jgi:H+/Cl- antiporter ClcA
LQLAGLAAGKLLVTAWSVATLYKGGVIYPLLVVGMSMALLFVGAYPDSTWLGVLLVATFVGAFSGNFKSAVIGAAFVLPLFGMGAITLVAAAVIGSVLSLKISSLFGNKEVATQ